VTNTNDGDNELDWVSNNEEEEHQLDKAKKIGSNWEEEFERYCKRRLDGVSTGVEALDKILLGIRGITIIQGAPGINKSTLALQIAVSHANLGQPVIFYDRENGINRLRMRILCQILNKSETDILTGEGSGGVSGALKNLPLWVVNNTSLEDLDKLVGKLVGTGQKKKTVMLVVDSLQKLPKKFNGDKRLSADHWMEGFDQLKLKYESNYVALVISEKGRWAYDEAALGGSKESGDNEYTGEVILDLRLQKKTRDIICTVVKDRDGLGGYEIIFTKELSDPNNPRSFIYKLKPVEVAF
jgi:hypothetical protein